MFWHGQHGQRTYLPAFVLVLCLCHCTVCTVLVPLVQWFGMASTSNVPILPVFELVLWLNHCTVCTVLVPLVQCSGMAISYPCSYSYCGCTIVQCVLCLYLLYSVVEWSARVMYLSYPCLYSYCACTIAQSVLCLYNLYSVRAWPARAMYLLTRVCARTVLIPLHSVYCACTPCTVVWHDEQEQCIYFARV